MRSYAQILCLLPWDKAKVSCNITDRKIMLKTYLETSKNCRSDLKFNDLHNVTVVYEDEIVYFFNYISLPLCSNKWSSGWLVASPAIYWHNQTYWGWRVHKKTNSDLLHLCKPYLEYVEKCNIKWNLDGSTVY